MQKCIILKYGQTDAVILPKFTEYVWFRHANTSNFQVSVWSRNEPKDAHVYKYIDKIDYSRPENKPILIWEKLTSKQRKTDASQT